MMCNLAALLWITKIGSIAITPLSRCIAKKMNAKMWCQKNAQFNSVENARGIIDRTALFCVCGSHHFFASVVSARLLAIARRSAVVLVVCTNCSA